MTAVSQTNRMSVGSQYAWRACSAGVVAMAVGCPGTAAAGVMFGITQYFFVSLYRTWVAKPDSSEKPRALVQSIAEMAFKFFTSHAASWGVLHLCGFKWTFAQIVAVSLAHVALGLLVTGLIYGLLHLMHVSLLRVVG